MTTAGILVPYLLADYIAARKNEYLKTIRPIDRLRPTVAEQRILSREWLA